MHQYERKFGEHYSKLNPTTADSTNISATPSSVMTTSAPLENLASPYRKTIIGAALNTPQPIAATNQPTSSAKSTVVMSNSSKSQQARQSPPASASSRFQVTR